MPVGPAPLQHDFTAGIRRSRARDDLGRTAGANVLWDARDWIIGRLGVPLGKRGGWQYQGSAAEASVDTTPSYANAMSNDPFNGGNFMRLQDINGSFWYAAASESYATWHKEMDYNNHGIEYNQAQASRQNGVFIGDGLFFPSGDGSNPGSTHNEIYGQDWPMSDGAGEVVYLTTHLNRLVGLDLHENLWFGNPNPDLAAWDGDGKYNLGQPGKGLASLGPDLLVFFDGEVRKVKGQLPAGYGVVADDIEIARYSGDIGCIDAFSIVKWNTQVIWVDHNGVWATDGTNYPLDLAFAGGAQDLFREFISSYVDRTTTRVACGIYNNMLVVSMTNVSDHTHIDTLVCDLNRRTWSRFNNCPFTCMVRGSLDTSETWAGLGHVTGRVAAFSTVLDPTSAVALDGDGEPVNPSFQTAYYRIAEQDSRIQEVWLGYEMDTNGIQEVQTITTEATSGTWTLEGEVLDFDASVADVQDVLDALDSPHATASGVPGAWIITFDTDGPQSMLAAVSVDLDEAITIVETQAGYDRPRLKFEFATDPRADPTFENYNGDPFYWDAEDLHGTDSDGYHWKPAPVRAQAGGVSVKVTQTGPSGTTSIHSIGIEAKPLPSYTAR